LTPYCLLVTILPQLAVNETNHSIAIRDVQAPWPGAEWTPLNAVEPPKGNSINDRYSRFRSTLFSDLPVSRAPASGHRRLWDLLWPFMIATPSARHQALRDWQSWPIFTSPANGLIPHCSVYNAPDNLSVVSFLSRVSFFLPFFLYSLSFMLSCLPVACSLSVSFLFSLSLF
jgi:hypothetical protein